MQAIPPEYMRQHRGIRTNLTIQSLKIILIGSQITEGETVMASQTVGSTPKNTI